LTDRKSPIRERSVRISTPFFAPKAGKSITPRPTSVPPRRSRLPDSTLIASCSQKASEPLLPMFTPVDE
jgi:hypothetical protein